MKILNCKLKIILFGFFLAIGFLFLKPTYVSAATATWTNTGADGLWSTCANWSGGTGTGGCSGLIEVT